MWFRRRRRQPPLDLSSLERSLDRLTELVQKIIALIPELVAAQPSNRDPPAPEPAPEPKREPEPAPEPEPEPEGHVLFVGGPNGYGLLQRAGPAPARGAVVDLDGESYLVLRLGPSPLPTDRRRCAFLERDGPPRRE